MSTPILTVTLNPALDMTGSLDTLKVGKVNLMDAGSLHPAGKGVNVAKVLCDLNNSVSVSGFLGADNDGDFKTLFTQINASDRFVRIDGATRINVKLVEGNGEVTDLNFPGATVSAEQKAAFEQTLFELAQQNELIVLAGSLPAGITPADLAGWVEQLATLGKKVVLDSSRDALKAALSAKPWLIKPNEDELSEWAGRELNTQEALMAVGEQLAATGISHVVISRGADGVLWFHDGRWLKSQPPRMSVVSTVGAGDTLVAGFCHGLNAGHSAEETLRFATALSALAVSQVGVGVPSVAAVEQLAQQVEITALT